jgi:hypothetical protein
MYTNNLLAAVVLLEWSMVPLYIPSGDSPLAKPTAKPLP